MDDFTRAELQDIRGRAIARSKIEGLNSSWKRAYERLADAADHLDAKIIRTTEQESAESESGDKPEGDLFGGAKQMDSFGERIS